MTQVQWEEGSSLLEFSLILPLVLLMFIGVVDLGFAVAEAMSVEDAARAGAEYGALPGKAGDLAGMQTAARNAAAGLGTLQVTASSWCSCTPNGGTVSCASTCSGSSPGNPVEYVQVQTNATVPTVLGIHTILNYTGLPTSLTLQGFSALRVQ